MGGVDGLTLPRHGTSRTPDRPTVGPRVERVAAALGFTLSPWQTHVAHVAGELDADGLPAHPVVVLHVGRRAGKSVLALATLVAAAAQPQHPAASTAPAAWYTAQNRAAASKLWRDEWAPRLRGLPRVKVRESNGSESARLPTGGGLALFAPSRTGLHSADADMVVVDEAWAFDLPRGQALEAAIVPAQSRSGRRPQLWIVSAGGDSESTWLASWLDRARGGEPGTAIFDWSAPDDVDPADPATWAAHPEHGRGITDAAMAAALRALNPAGFARAYLCVPSPAVRTSTPAFPGVERVSEPTGAPMGRITLGIEVTAGTVAVVAGIAVPGGPGPHLELVAEIPAVDAASKVRSLAARHRARIAADAYGPTGSLVADLVRVGQPVEVGRFRDVAQAAADLAAAIAADPPRLTLAPQPRLREALTAAAARPVGDVWTVRRDGTVAAATALAATLAHAHARRATSKPAVLTG